MAKQLIIFDLDETLLHSCNEWIGKLPSFTIEGAMVHLRPGALDLIKACSEKYAIAVWTASYGNYTKDIITNVFGEYPKLEFVYTREMCIEFVESDGYTAFKKDISLLMQIGWNISDILVIDDKPEFILPEGVGRLKVRPFFGSSNDNDLIKLADKISNSNSIEDILLNDL